VRGDVRRLAAVARQNNLQALLGVFSAYTDVGGSGFSWDRARKAFAGKRSAFVQQIVAEMEKFGLDGVEIDIESERDGLSDQDRADYAGLIIALAEEVHSRGKIITLSSFPGRWFGPNNTWWSDWAKVVDGIQSMGYAEVERKAHRIGTLIELRCPSGSRQGRSKEIPQRDLGLLEAMERRFCFRQPGGIVQCRASHRKRRRCRGSFPRSSPGRFGPRMELVRELELDRQN
jgi:hypothetical protein